MITHDDINGLLTIGVILFVITWGLQKAEGYKNYHDDDEDDYFNLN